MKVELKEVIKPVYRVESESSFKGRFESKILLESELVMFYQAADMSGDDWGRIRLLIHDSPLQVLRPRLGRSRRLVQHSSLQAIVPIFSGALLVLYSNSPDTVWGRSQPALSVLEDEPCLQFLGARWGNRILSADMFNELQQMSSLSGVQNGLGSTFNKALSIGLSPLTNQGALKLIHILNGFIAKKG